MKEREGIYTAIIPPLRADPRLLGEMRRRADAAGINNFSQYHRMVLTIALGLDKIRPVTGTWPQVRIDDEDDGTSETDTLDGFCDANPDEAAEVRALSVGGRVTFGGGAAPLITVTRIS